VIIPTLNEAERIDRAIRSAMSAGAGEVIVSDGGSEDDTAAVATEAGASVIGSPAGRGRQLQRGVRQASGALLVFLHADNRLGEDSLRAVCRLADNSANPEELWGGFRQRIESPRAIYRWLELGNAARIRYRGMPFGDQAMFVTRRLYDRVGGFAALPLMEDVDLSRRLRRIRWPTLVDAEVHVDPRRWEHRGVVRQTVRNWGIQTAHFVGVGEHRLSTWYR